MSNQMLSKWPSDARHNLIPGGAHTYSRGDDQYPDNAPELLVRGSGCTVWDASGREFVDWGMGLRSVILGYAEPAVDEAAIKGLRAGINLSRVTPDELELAARLRSLIPSAEMVKFGKNGSDATAGAVRVARAYTGRKLVLRAAHDPFLGVHDWFIGSTVMSRGVPPEVSNLTLKFDFNDIEHLSYLLDSHKGQVAAIILEPVGGLVPRDGYLEAVRELSDKHQIVLIFDETITGFRVHLGGAQARYDVVPDLSTFGKGMANGYPLSALVGRREIMKLGGIRHGEERVFLMSSTYGGERASIAAAMTTIELLQDRGVPDQLTYNAKAFMSRFRSLIEQHNLGERIEVGGLDLLPNLIFKDSDGEPDFRLKTLFMQLMVNRGILLAPYFVSFSAAHSQAVIESTLGAASDALREIRALMDSGQLFFLDVGPVVKPVFRQWN